MGVLVNASDFVGDLEVAYNDFTEQSFQDFIDSMEEYYSMLILGEKLRDDVFAYLANPTPVNPAYDKLLLPFSFQRGSRLYQSYGLKKTVALFIRAKWLNKTQAKSTVAGAGKGEADNTIINSQTLFLGWNDAVKSAKATQQYCIKNRSDFSNFRLTDIPYNHNA